MRDAHPFDASYPSAVRHERFKHHGRGRQKVLRVDIGEHIQAAHVAVSNGKVRQKWLGECNIKHDPHAADDAALNNAVPRTRSSFRPRHGIAVREAAIDNGQLVGFDLVRHRHTEHANDDLVGGKLQGSKAKYEQGAKKGGSSAHRVRVVLGRRVGILRLVRGAHHQSQQAILLQHIILPDLQRPAEKARQNDC